MAVIFHDKACSLIVYLSIVTKKVEQESEKDGGINFGIVIYEQLKVKASRCAWWCSCESI